MLVNVDTRVTRSHDAIVKVGSVELFFKSGKIKMNISNYIRNQNKQIVSDIEMILSDYIGEPANTVNCNAIADKLKPLVSKLEI